jgi:hypothetical protein
MADYVNTKTLNAILAKPGDWNDWHHEFELQAQTFGLESHITNKTSLLPQPEMPDIRKKKYTKKPHAQRNARSQTTNDEEEDEETIQEKNNGQWMMTDLTDNGLKAFNLDLTWYKQLDASYKEERQSVEKLTRWLLQTVAPAYKSTCCQAGEPLWKWHDNLQKRCGQSTHDEMLHLHQEYKKVLKPPRTTKEAYNWIDKWEEMMSKGIQKKLPETQHTTIWFSDFLLAIRGVMPIWATSYKQAQKHASADGSLEYRDIGQDFRQELESHDPQKGKVAKGAFTTTYDGSGSHDDENGDAHVVEDSKPPRRGATGSRGGKRGIRADPGRYSSGQKGCLACANPHALAECYYVFPEKAFPRWKPNQDVKERVREKLENDADFQAQVRALKGPRSKSKSRTPKPTKEEVVEEVED